MIKNAFASSQWLQRFWYLLPWLIILLGLLFRLQQYQLERSLWLDELFFAVNFLERDFFELFQLPLDYSSSHVAPPGFMLLTWISVNLLGLNEYSLRLLPLLCGIGALFLFERLSHTVLNPTAYRIALFLFAISDSLIFYSAEFKQYSCDVFISLALLLWFTQLSAELKLKQRQLLSLAFIGAVLLWFSHPAAFILAGMGIYLAVHNLWRRDWSIVAALLGIAALWSLSFVLMFYFVGGTIKESEIGRWLVTFWHIQQGFMPHDMNAVWGWLAQGFDRITHFPADLAHPTLILGLLIFGIAVFILNQQSALLMVLLLSILFTLLASWLEKYPFADRLVLFLMPTFYLLLAAGIAQLRFVPPLVNGNTRQLVIQTLNVLLLLGIVAYLIQFPQFPLYSKQYRQEIKPVLNYVAQQRQANDKVYIYYWAEPALRFYGNTYGLDYQQCALISPIPPQDFTKEVDFYRKQHTYSIAELATQSCILGSSEWLQSSLADLHQLQGQGRVWFIFSHAFPGEGEHFVEYLDRKAQRLETFMQPGAAAFLYAL